MFNCLILQTRALILFMLEPNGNSFFSLTQLIEIFCFSTLYLSSSWHQVLT